MLRNITKGNDFIVFEFMKDSIFLTDGKNLLDSIDQCMQWLSVLWTFFYIGPAKELGQYPALINDLTLSLAVYQYMTFCIYFDRRFAYTVSNIVGNTNTKKDK